MSINLEKEFELVAMYRENPVAAARDLLGIDLPAHQRLAIRAMWNSPNTLLVMGRGGGKCMLGDTLCLTDGGLFRIGKIHKVDQFGFNEDKINMYGESGFNSTSHTYKNKKSKIYQVETSCGYRYGAVGKHSVRVFEHGEIVWKRTDEVRIGDYAVIDRCGVYDFNGKYSDITEEAGYIIGALTGDGCYVKSGGVGFTNTEADVIKFIEDNCGSIGAYSMSHMKDPIEHCLLFGSRDDDEAFFAKYQIERVKSNLKTIPDTILQSSKRVLRSFISGYADTDGGVTDKGVEFSSVSKDLLNQLQVVLLVFGIISSVRHKKVKYKGGRRNAWILSIHSSSAGVFYNEIGFKCKRKQHALKKMILDKKCNPNKDVIPDISHLAIAVIDEYGRHNIISKSASREILKRCRFKQYRCGYMKLEKFLKATQESCSHMPEWVKLNHILNRNYFFDKVKNVSSDSEDVTYDVHIPEDHTFISNGFVSHNTFLDALFCVLRAMLYPGEKVGIISASFRQSKFVFAEVEKMYDMSPDLRAMCTRRPVKMTDMCYLDFIATGNRPGSVIHALPLGDGGKIRGGRYYTVVGDEAAQIPKDILNVVVRGMLATAKNPMEQVRMLEMQARLIREGKLNPEDVKRTNHNRIVLSSTAYFQYNHLWARVQNYINILTEKKKAMEEAMARGLPVTEDMKVYFRGAELNNGQIPFNIMSDSRRALIAFNCEDLPEGFMDQNTIDEARIESPHYEFMMEFFAYFPADSDGFFPRSLIDKSQNHRNYTSVFSLSHQSGKVNIMGIDPARNGANFAIVIIQLDIRDRKVRVKRMLTYNKQTYPYMHLEIRRLIKEYNIAEIAMDSGGGGTAIRDLLADDESCPLGHDVILQRDFDEHESRKGRRILTLVEFSRYEWLHDANHNLLLAFQNSSLELPVEKGALISSDSYDETPEEEMAHAEIKQLVEELQNIITKFTPTGRMQWDTAHKKQRKDRYSALLIGYDMANSYLSSLNKPQQLASGFWLKGGSRK